MKTEAPPAPKAASPSIAAPAARLPLRGWALDFARRWNGGTYSLFVIHGNIFDLFPVQDDSTINYVQLKTFLVRRLFPERAPVAISPVPGGAAVGGPVERTQGITDRDRGLWPQPEEFIVAATVAWQARPGH